MYRDKMRLEYDFLDTASNVKPAVERLLKFFSVNRGLNALEGSDGKEINGGDTEGVTGRDEMNTTFYRNLAYLQVRRNGGRHRYPSSRLPA